jgi:hypothetical protein
MTQTHRLSVIVKRTSLCIRRKMRFPHLKRRKLEINRDDKDVSYGLAEIYNLMRVFLLFLNWMSSPPPFYHKQPT